MGDNWGLPTRQDIGSATAPSFSFRELSSTGTYAMKAGWGGVAGRVVHLAFSVAGTYQGGFNASGQFFAGGYADVATTNKVVSIGDIIAYGGVIKSRVPASTAFQNRGFKIFEDDTELAGFTSDASFISITGRSSVLLYINNTNGATTFNGTSAFTKGIVTSDVSNDNQSIATRINSGFFQTSSADAQYGWPTGSSGYYNLIASTHNNTGNYYSLQICAGFFQNDDFYIRSTNNSGTTVFNRIALTKDFGTTNTPRVQREALTVTSANTLSALSKAYGGQFAELVVNGIEYASYSSKQPFTIQNGSKTVTWSATNSGYSLKTTDDVYIRYGW